MTIEKNTRKQAVVGMDLGGTKLSGALFTRDGEIIHKKEHLLKGRQGPEVGAMLVQQVLELDEFAREGEYQLLSIGISIPGISDRKKGSVWAPNIPGWEAYPLYKEVKDNLSNPQIPLIIESDRNCYIMGEIWKGSAKGCRNAVFIAVGTGIGVGIVANGEIISGMSGVSGAAGWMALDRPYKSEYDPCGQFEFYASGAGIVRSAEYMLSQGNKSKYLDSGAFSAQDVFSAYGKGDPLAMQVIDQCIELWGMAVANLVSILNPEKIIFGGGVFGPAVQFMDRIYEEALKWAQPISIQEVKLEASTLKGDSGLLGAGYLALMICSAMQNDL